MRLDKIFILPLLAVGIGCSSPDADGPMPEIIFEGVTSPRDKPTTTENIQEFSVTAYYGEGHEFTTLLDGVTVKRTGPNKWSYSPAVNWPDSPVNFLAISPAHNKIEVNYWWRNLIKDYTCTGTEDLLIATRFNAIQGAGNIKLNFRHIMSQVHVNLYTRHEESRIMIHKAYLKDIYMRGNYYLPTEDTTPIVPDGTSPVTGEWDIYNKSAVSYTIFSPVNDIALSGNPILINTELCFFIPGKLDPLGFSGYYHGSRIEVLYQVYDKESGDRLWPSSQTPYEDIDRDEPEYAIARYSLTDGLSDNTWLQGWSYNYTAELIPGSTHVTVRSATARINARKY